MRRISATPITNTYLVSVKWSPPRNLGSSGQLDHYAIRWGLVDGFPIEYIPIAENMTKVSHVSLPLFNTNGFEVIFMIKIYNFLSLANKEHTVDSQKFV